MGVADNKRQGDAHEFQVENALSDAGLNFDPRQGHFHIVVDMVLRSDDGERVALIECKSGEHNKHVQASGYAAESKDTSSKIVVYATDTGDSSKFTNKVLANHPQNSRFDQQGDGLEKLKSAIEHVKNTAQTAMITCRLDEVVAVARALVGWHESQHTEKLSAEDIADKTRDKDKETGDIKDPPPEPDKAEPASARDQARDQAREPAEPERTGEHRGSDKEPTAPSSAKARGPLAVDLDTEQLAKEVSRQDGVLPEHAADPAFKGETKVEPGFGVDAQVGLWRGGDRG